ncbi:MAG: hypothetical protein AAGG02_08940 [Cyanobacteria bacterium P01_H01_bin.15]
MKPSPLTEIPARLISGHQVASGQNQDPRFPDGTIRLQTPYFQKLGLDLTPYFAGTLNLAIAPFAYQIKQPKYTFRQVAWTTVYPPEDFSFFDCELEFANRPTVSGLIYYPHPDTKPEHFQASDTLEILAPFIPGTAYGQTCLLRSRAEQLQFLPPAE